MARSQELFELHFDGDLIFQGEQLYDQGAVQEIHKPEKSLYVVMVYDEIFYEVELFSPFAQRRKCSCECDHYKSHKACKHITAGLFALRTQLKNEQERKAQKAKQNTTPKKLNINTLLQDLDKRDILQFIKGYARKDKNFNIALKAHFARKVDLEDNKAKYKSILDSIIKPITSINNRAKSADLKNFINISKELISQMEDALSLSDYKDAHYIVEAGISKAEYVRYHYDSYADETSQISDRYHELLILLYQRVHASELKNSLLALIKELPQRSYYRHNKFKSHLYYLLIQKEYKDKELLGALKVIIEEILDTKRLEEHDKVTILSLLVMIDYYTTSLKNLEWFLNDHAGLTMNVVDRLVDAEEAEVSVKLMKKLKTHFPKSRELKRKLLQVYLTLGKISDLVKLLPTYVIQSDDLRLLYKLESKVSNEQWTEVIMKVINHYKTKPDKLHILASLYDHEEDYESLLQLLTEHSDLELVMQYDNNLHKAYPKELLEIYKKSLAQVLDSYLGEKAQISVKKALYHIEQIGARKIQRNLQAYLEKEYKHRLQYLF